MSRMMRWVLLLVFALPCLLIAGATSGPSSAVLKEVAKSVVRITAGSTSAVHKVGAGFLWPDPGHVVTALHVVDGSHEQITVFFIENGKIVESSPATVERVLKASDLVLLRLTTAQSRTALRIDTRTLEEHAQLAALGFPLGARSLNEIPLTLRRLGGTVLDDLLSPGLRALWKKDSYPSTQSQILNLSGPLIKGYSGGPVVDEQGLVVGIGNGGLEGGAASISWAIPALQLEQLRRSNEVRLPNSPVVENLFTADVVDPSADQAIVELDDVRLAMLRTRGFSRLAATADDKPALLALAAELQDFAPQLFRYDIYTDLPSGATLAVPAGLSLAVKGGELGVETGDGRIQMIVEIFRFHSDKALMDRFNTFVEQLTEDLEMVPNLRWHRRVQTGMETFVGRDVFYGVTRHQGQVVRLKCIYTVVAGNTGMRTVLLAAAVDNECTDENIAMESSCRAGLYHPACPALVAPRRLFAQLLLGIQFSTFSH